MRKVDVVQGAADEGHERVVQHACAVAQLNESASEGWKNPRLHLTPVLCGTYVQECSPICRMPVAKCLNPAAVQRRINERDACNDGMKCKFARRQFVLRFVQHCLRHQK